MQARTYADTLSAALKALSTGPAIPGVKERTGIGTNIRTLHVAREGRKGRHFVVFRVGNMKGRNVIDVLRLLHASMDLERHVPPTALPGRVPGCCVVLRGSGAQAQRWIKRACGAWPLPSPIAAPA